MKNKLLFFSLSLVLLSACNFGTKKDLLTGLKVNHNGLSYEEAYIQLDSSKLSTYEFETGKDYYLFFTGVKGFTLKEGMLYLGGSLDIIDESGTKIMDNPDLFTGYDQTGVNPVDAEVIHFKLTVGSPMEAGKTYTWKSTIWDKNGTGKIEAELPFTVK